MSDTGTTLTALRDRYPTVADLARELGVDRSHVSNLLAGRRPVTPDLERRIAELAARLDREDREAQARTEAQERQDRDRRDRAHAVWQAREARRAELERDRLRRVAEASAAAQANHRARLESLGLLLLLVLVIVVVHWPTVSAWIVTAVAWVVRVVTMLLAGSVGLVVAWRGLRTRGHA